MNLEYASYSIGAMDERFVIEAEQAKPRRRNWLPWAAAACAALAAGIVMLVISSGRGGNRYAGLPKISIMSPYDNVGGGRGEITFGIPSGELPTANTANVRRVRETKPDPAIAKRIAGLFGAVDADIEAGEDEDIVYIENGFSVVFTPGRLTASIDLEDVFVTERPLPDEEYIGRAKAFLNETGLDLSGFDMDEPRIVKNGVRSNGAGNELEAFASVTVVFMHLPVDGISEIRGGPCMISVDLTPYGTVKAINAGLYDFYEPTEYPLLDVNEVMRMYEADPESVLFYSNWPYEDGGFTAEEVSLEWLNVPEYLNEMHSFRTYECNWLIPVYVFKGVSGGESFVAIMRAIPEEYLELTPKTEIGG